MEKIIKITINTLIVMLVAVMLFSLVEILLLLVRTIVVKNEFTNFLNPTINRDNLFITSVQGFIAAALLITIIIEVIESLREYQQKNKVNYTKVILEIAIIAVIRHVLVLDFEHTNAGTLVGIATLILVLGLFYLVLNKNFKISKNEE